MSLPFVALISDSKRRQRRPALAAAAFESEADGPAAGSPPLFTRIKVRTGDSGPNYLPYDEVKFPSLANGHGGHAGAKELDALWMAGVLDHDSAQAVPPAELKSKFRSYQVCARNRQAGTYGLYLS
jgi:hypothetical protein